MSLLAVMFEEKPTKEQVRVGWAQCTGTIEVPEVANGYCPLAAYDGILGASDWLPATAYEGSPCGGEYYTARFIKACEDAAKAELDAAAEAHFGLESGYIARLEGKGSTKRDRSIAQEVRDDYAAALAAKASENALASAKAENNPFAALAALKGV